jgi:Uma2 family endonuclease
MKMNTAPVETLSTEEDFPEMPDKHGYELINGEWVEKNMGAQAGLVVLTVNRRVANHADAHRQGLVFSSDAGYQIFAHKPNRVRKPDGSFIRRGRLLDDKPPRGHLRIAPDLAIEVISPNDLAEDIEERVADFLQAGTKIMWVLHPSTRTVYVFRQGNSVTRLTASDELSGEDVLPGFVCRVEELFIGI